MMGTPMGMQPCMMPVAPGMPMQPGMQPGAPMAPAGMQPGMMGMPMQ